MKLILSILSLLLISCATGLYNSKNIDYKSIMPIDSTQYIIKTFPSQGLTIKTYDYKDIDGKIQVGIIIIFSKKDKALKNGN